MKAEQREQERAAMDAGEWACAVWECGQPATDLYVLVTDGRRRPTLVIALCARHEQESHFAAAWQDSPGRGGRHE